jgi:hypothetical protein
MTLRKKHNWYNEILQPSRVLRLRFRDESLPISLSLAVLPARKTRNPILEQHNLGRLSRRWHFYFSNAFDICGGAKLHAGNVVWLRRSGW